MAIYEQLYAAYTILKSGNGMNQGDGMSSWSVRHPGAMFFFSKDRFGTYTIERLYSSVGYHCINVNGWCGKRGIDVEQLTLEDFQVMVFERWLANV